MSYKNPDALVTTDWLATHLCAPDIQVIDASWAAPGGGDVKAAYQARHIPGAIFFDIDDIAANPDGDLPHMMPDAATFSAKLGRLGLRNNMRMVVYDQNGISAAACRVWWMLRYFGHNEVAVLDGGFPKWLAEDRPTDDIAPPIRPGVPFRAQADSALLRHIDQIKANVISGREQLVDARAADRFEGTGDEAWGAAGRIPGSLNLPFTELLTGPHKTIAPADEIAATLKRAGIARDKPIIASCGPGVTACVLALGLYLIGDSEVAVYDGSWAEWVRDPSTQKVTGKLV